MKKHSDKPFELVDEIFGLIAVKACVHCGRELPGRREMTVLPIAVFALCGEYHGGLCMLCLDVPDFGLPDGTFTLPTLAKLANSFGIEQWFGSGS